MPAKNKNTKAAVWLPAEEAKELAELEKIFAESGPGRSIKKWKKLLRYSELSRKEASIKMDYLFSIKP